MSKIMKNIKCIKRNGKRKKFDETKIFNAISKANTSINNYYTNEEIQNTTDKIVSIIENKVKHDMKESSGKPEIGVEEIQDIVVNCLMESLRMLATEYITYRYKRYIARNGIILVDKYKERVDCKNVVNANANVDEMSSSGKEKEAAADISKAIALEFGGLSKKTAQAHKDMLVYQHDLEKAIFGIHNCLFLDFDTVLNTGWKTRNGDVRKPSTFQSATQQIAVLFQCQSQVQFGGVATIHLDTDLAPFVQKSFTKHFRNGLIYIAGYDKETVKLEFPKTRILSIEDIDIESKSSKIENLPYSEDIGKVYKYAMEMLDEEMKQSCEAFYHNINTLESRPGSQVPFTSINYGRDTTPEGRMVTKYMMQASINGIGKNHITSIFPISIFQYKKGCNANEGDPNYDLFELALESTSKRIYPNFINCDFSEAHEDPNDKETLFCCMGCRTLVGYDRNGLGYKRQGRGNNVPNTIILPKLGIEYGICLGKRETADLDGFWKAFEETLLLTENALLERYKIIAKQSPKSGPFMYQNGTMKDAINCKKTVKKAVKHNTLAIGYIGIAELCRAMFGQDHADNKEVYDFAIKVVQRINTFAKEASIRNNLNFSCYATPAENLCKTAALSLREQYGVIKGVTDRDYLTNSHHISVWKEISIQEKLELEAPFCKFATGGCITYVELDSMTINNKEAMKDIIHYAFDVLDIPYLAFNFPIDECEDCGYTGEISTNWCPECLSSAILRLRRITGYLNRDLKTFNKGKQAEVKDRFVHSKITNLNKFKNK